MPKGLKAAIVGGSGFVGRELTRLLLQHPEAAIAQVFSREHAGKPVSAVHQGFEGLLPLSFLSFAADGLDADVVFLAMSHGESMGAVLEISKTPRFKRGELKIIDLGADFRLPKDKFEETYRLTHACPDLLAEAVYGVPEINPGNVAKARLIANPGCFAHCIYLSLAPLVQTGLSEDRVSIAAVTGSSGSGIKAQEKTHHPNRNESLSAYQVLKHRHVPEIEHALSEMSPGAEPKLSLVPISGPVSRGIFAASFVQLRKPDADVGEVYREFCAERTFCRLREESPKLIDVRGSNFFDVSVTKEGDTAAVIGVIDNMVKGAAGNAIQCMNLMFGLPEAAGLAIAPLSP